IRRHRHVELEEDARPEQMMRDSVEWCADVERSEERNLVHVVDHYVEFFVPEFRQIGPRKPEVEQIPSTGADDTDAVQIFFGEGAAKRRAEENNLVAHFRDAGKDFVQVDFRTSCEGILDVLPVDDKDAQEDEKSG
ncbi:MAG: hypothetical protein HW407_500, partial [Bacteroidetes bacterium]|nr:hypothetical protein [Bacteroidota bacterium]